MLNNWGERMKRAASFIALLLMFLPAARAQSAAYADADLANTGSGIAVYYGGRSRETALNGFDEISTDNTTIGWE
jgi:hypothetical protein